MGGGGRQEGAFSRRRSFRKKFKKFGPTRTGMCLGFPWSLWDVNLYD